MDTSKEYVKMCEKAEEIQKEWKPKQGDYEINKRFLKEEVTKGFITFSWWDLTTEGKVWLPRQDRLQEMIEEGNAYTLTIDFLNWMEKESRKPYPDDQMIMRLRFSMEQLWLAFVMKEKYNKTWDGKEWVKGG